MVLHLTLKKKWFKMIASGEKKTEYRECKPYWNKRFQQKTLSQPKPLKKFSEVVFTNGYGKHSPKMRFEVEGLSIGFGNPEWGGDENNLQYRINLGKRLTI